MISRPRYMKILMAAKDKQIIKVLTGVRRSGKSTILNMFRQGLIESGTEANQIQHFNFENIETLEKLDYKSLHDEILSNMVPDKQNYIILDEIQLIDQFEKTVNSLFLRENIDIYITGSNAHMLSGELATLLSGRYIEIMILPLSFTEFWSALDGTNKEDAFKLYLEKGGFPYALQINDDLTYSTYIDGILNTVLIKDVLARKQLSNTTLTQRLAQFLTDSSGSAISYKKIADTLTSYGFKTSSETVSSYIAAFKDAFLFYQCDRYDINGKRYLSTNAKFYPVDQSFRGRLVGRKRPNIGHRLEGIVYLELLRRGYEVYVGSVESVEVDFVAIKDGITEYFQVSYSVKDDATYLREFKPLHQINDNYRKTILTLDQDYFNDQGLEHINLIDWLTQAG